MTPDELRRAAELLYGASEENNWMRDEMLSLAAKLEQMAKQEPVAWMYTHPLNETWVRLTRRMESGNDWTETPLYAAPVEIPREDAARWRMLVAHMQCMNDSDSELWFDPTGPTYDADAQMFTSRIDAALAAEQTEVKKHNKPCPNCGGTRVRSEQWDAYYCPNCNAWLEPKCSVTKEQWEADPYRCHYRCFDRPDKPLAAEQKT